MLYEYMDLSVSQAFFVIAAAAANTLASSTDGLSYLNFPGLRAHHRRRGTYMRKDRISSSPRIFDIPTTLSFPLPYRID